MSKKKPKETGDEKKLRETVMWLATVLERYLARNGDSRGDIIIEVAEGGVSVSINDDDSGEESCGTFAQASETLFVEKRKPRKLTLE